MGTYHSTRGRTLSCSSKVAIRTGIAPDGGLFVSDELGTQQVDISSLADKSYFEIAQDVLGMLLNDYTAEEISACVDEAYRGTFASEEVTPLVKLDAAPGADAPQTYVMELFGGPTSAFKDVALQMLPRLMARTSARDGGAERIMIVTATSATRQGRARRFCRRSGHGHHRLLSRGQGQPRPEPADVHAGGRQRRRLRHPRQL